MEEITLTVDELLAKLIENGGSIVLSNNFQDAELRQARREKRFAVNDDGIGFVWIP